MKHKYTDEQIQTAIDAALSGPRIPAELVAARSHELWHEQAGYRLRALKSALDKLPEPPPPTADGKTPGRLVGFEDIAMKLCAIGWTGNNDAQWEGLRDAMPELHAMFGSSLEAAIARMEAHGKTWNSYKKGDPMPCDGERMVCLYRQERENFADAAYKGSGWNWIDPTIIGWRYADEPTSAEPVKPWTPAVGDVVTKANPVQDMALGGQMYWRDLARQLAEVWWKCHTIGASLQHGDNDADVSFSIVCEKHGGQVFHADTPHNAWLKAEKWLMSPDRENFPAATLQLA